MSNKTSLVRSLILPLLSSLILSACTMQRKTSAGTTSPTQQKQLMGEQTRGWLQYRFFLHSASPCVSVEHQKGIELVMSIVVVNKYDATSPLRKVCSSLEDYNTRYEYLLNDARNDIAIEWAGHVYHPVYYAFENNYNTMPFETINIGFRTDRKFGRKHGTPMLRFANMAMGSDTVSCQLPSRFLSGVK